MRDTILIIEDDRRTAEWIGIYLERAGFKAERAYDGPSGLGAARSLKPDLIILDLMLPRLNGSEICRILRRESDVPLIITTARGAREERIGGLEDGADDYMVKPFDPDELVARVKALLRRSAGNVRSRLTCGILELDEDSRTVYVGGDLIGLSQAQYAVLSVFMRHPNMVLSRNQLIEQAFDNDFDGFERAVDTHIKRLRKLIHRDGFNPLQTVYGAGYKLVCS